MLFISCQVSSALSYLESRQIIHRDVATRNCLVFSDYLIKLTDLAMGSPLYTHCYATDAYLPVRWMAPELLMVNFYFFFFIQTFGGSVKFLTKCRFVIYSFLERWKWIFKQIRCI